MATEWYYAEYLLFGIGFTELVLRGTILAGIRAWFGRWEILRELFSCSLCLGFWSGVLAGLCLWAHHGVLHPTLPCVTSIGAWLFDSLIDALHSVELALDAWRENLLQAKKQHMQDQQEPTSGFPQEPAPGSNTRN